MDFKDESWQFKLAPLFIIIGFLIILFSLTIGLFVLAPTAQDYWAGNTKQTRDAAQAGSQLIAQLLTLTTIPKWLEPLTFFGVASFMVGIAMFFSTIPGKLEERAKTMSSAFNDLRRLANKEGGN